MDTPDSDFPSAALSETARKTKKSKNETGNPIKLPSKILALCADPDDDGAIYAAEAAGTVKRVVLEVGRMSLPSDSLEWKS